MNRLPDMNSHLLSGLMRKRAELAGKVEHAEAHLNELQTALSHVDAVMRMVSPDLAVEQIPPKRAYAPRLAGPPIGRLVLDAMRGLSEPVGSWEVTGIIMQNEHVHPLGRNKLDHRVRGWLTRQNGRLVEKVGEWPARWVVAERT